MTDLWTSASVDVEAENLDRHLTSARIASAAVWPFLAAATSEVEYANRKALAADRIDRVAAAVAENDPALFSVVRASLEDGFDTDFAVLHGERVAEAKIEASKTKARLEAEASIRAQAEREVLEKVLAAGLDNLGDAKAEPFTTAEENVEKKDEDEKTASKTAASDGDTSTCKNCGKPVEYAETAWVHTPSLHPRCMADGDGNPVQVKNTVAEPKTAARDTGKVTKANLQTTAGDSVEIDGTRPCDVCKAKQAKYDARLPGLGGSWGNVCQDCFDAYGPGETGTGHAQKLVSRSSRKTAFLYKGQEFGTGVVGDAGTVGATGAVDCEVCGQPVGESGWEEAYVSPWNTPGGQQAIHRHCGNDVQGAKTYASKRAANDAEVSQYVNETRGDNYGSSIALTNVGIEGNDGVGTDPNGKRVRFHLSASDLASLKSVLYSDLAMNFSGVTIGPEDIIKGASKTAAEDQTGDLFSLADGAYERQDRQWFYNLSTSDLEKLWGAVSAENFLTPAGAWDDEVADALAARGFFDKTGRRKQAAFPPAKDGNPFGSKKPANDADAGSPDHNADQQGGSWQCPQCGSANAYTQGGVDLDEALKAHQPIQCGDCKQVDSTGGSAGTQDANGAPKQDQPSPGAPPPPHHAASRRPFGRRTAGVRPVSEMPETYWEVRDDDNVIFRGDQAGANRYNAQMGDWIGHGPTYDKDGNKGPGVHTVGPLTRDLTPQEQRQRDMDRSSSRNITYTAGGPQSYSSNSAGAGVTVTYVSSTHPMVAMTHTAAPFQPGIPDDMTDGPHLPGASQPMAAPPQTTRPRAMPDAPNTDMTAPAVPGDPAAPPVDAATPATPAKTPPPKKAAGLGFTSAAFDTNQIECPNCKGEGCPRCGGTGTVPGDDKKDA